MSDQRIEKIYSKLKEEVISETDPNMQLIKSEQLIFFCWQNYPVRFSDVDVESKLEKLFIKSEKLAEKKNNHIVFVASTLFAVGGHSRCILSFIDNLPNFTHTIILTRQQKTLPENVSNFLKEKNVDIVLLETNLLPFEKSLKLKTEVDNINPSKVYLFQHPDDLAPLIAFGKNTSHEVVQYSHADHVFSIGTKYFSKQLEFRNTGALISHYGKNVKSPQIQVLPIQNIYETPNRNESKTKLGFDSTQKIIGSLTNFGKAKSYNNSPSLVDVLLTFSATYPNCIFLVIGLTESEFKTIAVKTIQIPKNIHCVGIVVDPLPYYQVFDFFLEPFPIGSGLGILEACKHGAIPIFSPIETSLCATFEVFHPSIQSELIEATTFDALYLSIEHYLNLEPEKFNALSEKIKNKIYQYHRGEKWASNLENGLDAFDNSTIKNPEEFLKMEAMFFQYYQKKSSNELIEHLLSLKQLVSKKLLLSLLIGKNRLFSIFDLNKQNVKRMANKFLKL